MKRKPKPKPKRQSRPAARVRVTQAEKAARVETVLELLVNGASRREIIAYIAQKTPWNVSDKTIDDYIVEARDDLRAAAGIDADQELAKAFRRFENLYARALRVQDYKVCLAIEKARLKFCGLSHRAEDREMKGRVEIIVTELRRLEREAKDFEPPRFGVAIIDPSPSAPIADELGQDAG